MHRITHSAVAADGDDAYVAESARQFGLGGASDSELARVVRGLLNATSLEAAGETLSAAAVDSLVSAIEPEVVPVLRCLVTLGGMLKEVRARAV